MSEEQTSPETSEDPALVARKVLETRQVSHLIATTTILLDERTNILRAYRET